MDKIIGALILFMFVVCAEISAAQNSAAPPSDKTVAEFAQIGIELKTVRQDIEILRRDQINYRVEKDLLKEAYASNLQIINLGITISLAVIGLIGGMFGYFGLKSIQSVKAEYIEDLAKMRSVRSELEIEINAVREKQMVAKEQIDELAKTNQNQDRRLKVLEIIEKASSYFASQQYSFALEFVGAGLAIDPQNKRLFNVKALCYLKMRDILSAIEVLKSLLTIYPDDVSALENLAEAYLLVGQVDAFDKLYNSHKQVLDEDRNGVFIVYLKAVRAMAKDDMRDLKENLSSYVGTCVGATPRLGSWQFEEVTLCLLNKMPACPLKSLCIATVGFFKGDVAAEALKPLLAI